MSRRERASVVVPSARDAVVDLVGRTELSDEDPPDELAALGHLLGRHVVRELLERWRDVRSPRGRWPAPSASTADRYRKRRPLLRRAPRARGRGPVARDVTPAPHVEPWPSPISTHISTAAPRQPTSDRTPESATKHLDVVRVEGTITGDEHESLGLGLRDQQAVERVAVVRRKSPGPLGVLQ